MAEPQEFLFEIDVPARTLPMSQLALYVTDLAAMLGNEEHVHLVEIRESSTILVPIIDDIALQRVHKQVLAVRNGSAPQKAMRSYESIDNRLADDSATAVLRAPYGTVIQFPGKSKPVSEVLGPVVESETIDGEIIQIGGRDETISVYIRDRDKRDIYICTTTRDKGRKLALLIFQQVRIHGQATWIRANNRWKREGFSIDTWSALNEQSLENVIQQLRDVPTPNIDNIDPFAILAELRGDNGNT